MPAGLVVGELTNLGAASVGIRIGNVTATAVASQASMPGTLSVARGGATSLGLPGAILGVALTSTGAATSNAVQMFVTKS
jgi:hypothetical protein